MQTHLIQNLGLKIRVSAGAILSQAAIFIEEKRFS
jgi:hypothetical protein